jgi:hypothetical protein
MSTKKTVHAHSKHTTTTNNIEEETTMSNSKSTNVVINPPPAEAKIPAPDAGWTPPEGNPYRGMAPKKAELIALPDAVAELRGFTAYAATFAGLAPPQHQLVQTLDAAEQWAKMGNATAQWVKYCTVETGVVWSAARGLLARLRPAFALALMSDPSLASTLPKTAAFLGVRKQMGRTAASTRTANKKAEASGKPAFHGSVGKKRLTKAQKDAFAEKQQQQQEQQQSAAESPPAAKTDPAPTITNGAAHS